MVGTMDLKTLRITPEQWDAFDRQGFVNLGRVFDQARVASLCTRLDDLMLGKVQYPGLIMQLETGAEYEALPTPTRGFIKPTLGYRKLQGLEVDPLFHQLVEDGLFREAAARLYGPHQSISLFRAMLHNKPAGMEAVALPWHQDAGEPMKLDRDPLLTAWIALDPATPESGCMQVMPGSHKLGALETRGTSITEENVRRFCHPRGFQRQNPPEFKD